ncbi:hypothetical protein M433DRAFT_378971 [Acidomyces richmondensis BFW]|nr:MAG: hypothetical protein FE78DRAFT_503727 [Acidomyces sp. 'richmondensis']KYG42983.1 hypothetical protein M433DRAFT_378971 [Acidomyces richmondensis BFW]
MAKGATYGIRSPGSTLRPGPSRPSSLPRSVFRPTSVCLALRCLPILDRGPLWLCRSRSPLCLLRLSEPCISPGRISAPGTNLRSVPAPRPSKPPAARFFSPTFPGCTRISRVYTLFAIAFIGLRRAAAHQVRWLLWRAPFLSPTAPTSLSPRALFWSQCRACCFASPRFPFASSTTIIVTSRILDEVLHHFLGSAKKFLTSRGWAGDAMLSCMRRNGGRSKKVF